MIDSFTTEHIEIIYMHIILRIKEKVNNSVSFNLLILFIISSLSRFPALFIYLFLLYINKLYLGKF